MILADKIILQRKKCTWSQEELAEKLNVSRQAISKWESAQTTPDLARILEMGRLFGVSTDYLLKDEIEQATPEEMTEEAPVLRKVSLQEANHFLKLREQASLRIALATFLCMLSPICLLFLGALSERNSTGISENFAGGVGLAVLLLLVAVAVAIFISCGVKSQPFAFLETEAFETEYGVTGMVRQRQQQYHGRYLRSQVAGACICILSVLPLFTAFAFWAEDLVLVAALCILLLLAGIGVCFFLVSGIRMESMQKLLQEGSYTKANKKRAPFTGAVITIYWLVAVALFLGYSFATDDWQQSWIIWPVAGVLFPAVLAACNMMGKKQ